MGGLGSKGLHPKLVTRIPNPRLSLRHFLKKWPFSISSITGKNGEKAEMSFIDHLEELRWHVIRSVIAVLVGAVVIFIYSDFVVNDILFAPTRSDFISARWLCRFGHSIGIGDTLCFQQVDAKFLKPP